MAPLTTAGRRRLSTSSFALPGRRYPANDASHARNALSRVSQHGTPEEKAAVRAKVHARFPTIGKKKKRSLADHLTRLRSTGAFRPALRR
jgi:hypothetical protein